MCTVGVDDFTWVSLATFARGRHCYAERATRWALLRICSSHIAVVRDDNELYYSSKDTVVTYSPESLCLSPCSRSLSSVRSEITGGRADVGMTVQ